MKRIAFVSDAIYPYNKGGKETRLYEISTRLGTMGYDVHIYTMKWWPSEEKIRKEYGVTLHAISPYFPLYSGERRSIKQGLLFGLHCLKMIKENFDIVDVDHMPFFPLYTVKFICILKRKRMYATWHEFWGRKYWIEYMGWKGYIANVVEYISFYMPNTIISVSDYTTEKLLNHIQNKKIVTVKNGVNIEEISEIIPKINKSDIIYAGRLIKHKNIDVLLHSIQQLIKKYPKLLCLIIGDGPEKQKLVKISQKLKLSNNITFLAFTKTKAELYSYLKSSKIFVLPSSREGFGFSVLEALANNLYVITVNEENNASRFLVTNSQNGFVTSLNPKSIASSISKTLKLKRKPFSKNFLSSYSWTNIVTNLEQAYLT